MAALKYWMMDEMDAGLEDFYVDMRKKLLDDQEMSFESFAAKFSDYDSFRDHLKKVKGQVMKQRRLNSVEIG